jgi:hypothetical protein
MAMSELWIPEAIVCLFLALPLFRPLVKTLWPLDGLVWLPLAAVVITVGIFPAYGFRPECLPILLFGFIYTIANLDSIISSIRSQPSDAFRDRNPLLTVFAFIMLGAAVFTMFAFLPRTDSYTETETARMLKIPGESVGRDYYLQIYGQTGRPIIFLIPPELGSSASVKLVCSELENKGYTVVTYSRKNFDLTFIDEIGKKHFSLLLKMPGYLYASLMGTRLVSANKRGKAMETERRADIEYLLPRIYGLTGETDYEPILLAGYGAGGSALAYLNDKGGFGSNNNVLGIIAVESRLWSSYETDAPVIYRNSSTRGFNYNILTKIVDSLTDLLPKTLKRTKTLLPSANLPVLYLVSGRALNYPLLDYGRGKNPYQAIFDTQRLASDPIAIVAIENSGPLDYQDFPLTHPVYCFSLPGQLSDALNAISDTAGIIGNFASLLIEQSMQAAQAEPVEPEEPEDDKFQQPVKDIPPRSPINGSLFIESRAMKWLEIK